MFSETSILRNPSQGENPVRMDRKEEVETGFSNDSTSPSSAAPHTNLSVAAGVRRNHRVFGGDLDTRQPNRGRECAKFW
jgi:hypothetical protein